MEKLYGVYRGSVDNNEDPENLGRLKVRCPALYGDGVSDWAFPRGMMAGNGHGVFWIPSKGDPIYVSCENGDARYPLWEYGWFTKNNLPEGAKPKVKVFQTPHGHRIEMNDEDKFIHVKHPSGFNVKLYDDGIYLGKGNKNLGKFLTDLFTLLSATTVPTVYGASPFNNKAAYDQLKNEIADFLKTA